MPRAQRTAPPASQARQGLVPGPAASPGSSQEGEMLQDTEDSFRKPQEKNMSTVKVTRLFPGRFPQEIYVCIQDPIPLLHQVLTQTCAESTQGFNHAISVSGEDHIPLTLVSPALPRPIPLCPHCHCPLHYPDCRYGITTLTFSIPEADHWFTLVRAVYLVSTAGHVSTLPVYGVKIRELLNQPVMHHTH